ncbi:MAG: magnesium/cobalt transporter CorA [Sulfurimonas sp.]|uniref:magnesium/cobalt transporter CorA n=1 Tax=Sulfurimonas sp. TaxID=2022749 RepID=UPI002628BAA1|nr:magnesium/cobalt transporter CorA [Sulfurimonas sp.]MDD2652261.1 magnesium/cobalt transporter CorA [Sulfurimonas sp.]MDD3451570.1 magnesium/cobalt transporter CorA [Sulfurimonas sp.]
MVRFYTLQENRFQVHTLDKIEGKETLKDVLWVDLLQPTKEEIERVEAMFGVDVPDKFEREEIELSSRYWENNDTITINSYFFISFFFVKDAKGHYNESVGFVIKENTLFTIRDSELRTFDTVHKMVSQSQKEFASGYEIFMQIFDIRIDQDADLLEYASRESDEIRKKLLLESDVKSTETLKKIATLQEFTLKIRQGVFDKRRILTSMAKSSKPPQAIKEDLFIMMRDINSLVEFIAMNDSTLENLQNLFLAQTGIEQNKIIKLFTVANVVLMPPTLIASIYGMNFHFMPELGWTVGYPLSLGIMMLSGVIPLLYFKNRGWL